MPAITNNTIQAPDKTWRNRAKAIGGYLRMDRSPKAIKSLDGLRGIAIILVLFRHAIKPFYNACDPQLTIAGWDPMVPFMNGWIGVDLFFVLSGFLVTHHLLKRSDGELTIGKIRDYLVKRFFRIVPAYYVFLLIVVSGVIPYYDLLRPEQLGKELITHLLFMQDYYGAGLVGAFWSLGVEEKFYFAAPFLVWALLKQEGGLARVRLLGMLIALPITLRCITFISHWPVPSADYMFWLIRSPFHLAADALLMGSLCAVLLHHRQEFRWLQSKSLQRGMFWCGASLATSLLLVAPIFEEVTLFAGTMLLPLLGLSFALVLLSLVLDADTPKPMLDGRGLFFFSKISYSLYLVHMVFVQSVFLFMSQFGWFGILSPFAQFTVYFPIFTAVSVAFALVLHYAVEKPFLIVKDSYRGKPTSGATILGSLRARSAV